MGNIETKCLKTKPFPHLVLHNFMLFDAQYDALYLTGFCVCEKVWVKKKNSNRVFKSLTQFALWCGNK